MALSDLLRAAQECTAGHCDEAIVLMERTLREQPCNAELVHQLGVCHSGACRKHSQVCMPLAIAYLERAVDLARTSGEKELQAKYLDSLGNALLRSEQPARAREVLDRAAALYVELREPDEWAREEFNLGNACSAIAESGQPDDWAEAVRHYRNALRVRTRKHDPLHFAATAQNLGAALRALPASDETSNLKTAIRYYLSALRVYLRAHLAGKCADVHNNLGNAYLCLSLRSGFRERHLALGLGHFRRALCVRTKKDRPCDYGTIQFNRAQAYLELCGASRDADFERALDCIREAAEGFQLCGDTDRAAVMRDCLNDLISAGRPAVLRNVS